MRSRLLFAMMSTVALSAALSVGSLGGATADSDDVRFSNPTQIFNPFVPMSTISEDILAGTKEGKPFRVIRTVKKGTQPFNVDGHTVQTLIVEDRDIENGELVESTLDYFGQSDDGTVHYFGEDATQFQNGQVVGHEGSWRFGVNTEFLGTILPGKPQVGQKWQAENVPGTNIVEDDEVLTTSATVNVPAGTFRNCVKTKETTPDGVEFKYYCPTVGVVKEIAPTDQVSLVSHRSCWHVGQSQ